MYQNNASGSGEPHPLIARRWKETDRKSPLTLRPRPKAPLVLASFCSSDVCQLEGALRWHWANKMMLTFPDSRRWLTNEGSLNTPWGDLQELCARIVCKKCESRLASHSSWSPWKSSPDCLWIEVLGSPAVRRLRDELLTLVADTLLNFYGAYILFHRKPVNSQDKIGNNHGGDQGT